MEALTISAANLDTIEKNLGAVADELSGVITNVSTVNAQVNKVEEKVAGLNDEVKNLVKEIRETTIITNARQSIMYNNSQIEKKYGYYDKVRRTTESLIDAVLNSSVDAHALFELKQDLILNNPNYWLANALASLTSWILNDKENTYKELNNALRKDKEKTSIFFCLVNLKLGRNNTALNWLNNYLSYQNPMSLDKDFVSVLDLVATGTFGNQAKNVVFEKIKIWFDRIASEKEIHETQKNVWKDYINSFKSYDIYFTYLKNNSSDVNILENNLAYTGTYDKVLNKLESIAYNASSNKGIDDILNNLIYEYEGNEQVYQKDNLLNNLIISCNGNREEALRLFKKQENIYNDNVDIVSLLTNIIINKELYVVSNDTQKMALALVKDYVLIAYEDLNKTINTGPYNINIDNYVTKSIDGTNKDECLKDLDIYISKLFDEDDKGLIIALIIINVIGIIGIFITLNNRILSMIIICILALGDLFLFYKLNRRTKLRNDERKKQKQNNMVILEKVLAELYDYTTIYNNNLETYGKLKTFLNSINVKDYISSNNERNIDIGE